MIYQTVKIVILLVILNQVSADEETEQRVLPARPSVLLPLFYSGLQALLNQGTGVPGAAGSAFVSGLPSLEGLSSLNGGLNAGSLGLPNTASLGSGLTQLPNFSALFQNSASLNSALASGLSSLSSLPSLNGGLNAESLGQANTGSLGSGLSQLPNLSGLIPNPASLSSAFASGLPSLSSLPSSNGGSNAGSLGLLTAGSLGSNLPQLPTIDNLSLLLSNSGNLPSVPNAGANSLGSLAIPSSSSGVEDGTNAARLALQEGVLV